MTNFVPTPHTALKQHRERARYDRDTVHAILDEGLICHLGFVADGRPFVIPTLYARIGDTVYVHGAVLSRMMATGGSGAELCLTVTLLDGLVFARSAFSHSMNYRSVVVLGRGRLVTGPDEKIAALEATVEHVARGRWTDARQPTVKELNVTSVIALALDEVSAKVRTGPPVDVESDYALSVWAGVLPLRVAAGAPVPDPRFRAGTAPPAYVSAYARPGAIVEK